MNEEKVKELGKISEHIFNADQLNAIMKGSDRIPGLTWHYHQNVGRLQLIPQSVHQKTGHVGGMDLWFSGLVE
ncbi:MAG: hypothetical protein HEEMFOPI_02057 [Holosporales bacterium]